MDALCLACGKMQPVVVETGADSIKTKCSVCGKLLDFEVKDECEADWYDADDEESTY